MSISIQTASDPGELIKKKIAEAVSSALASVKIPTKSMDIGSIPTFSPVVISSYHLKLSGGHVSESPHSSISNFTNPSGEIYKMKVKVRFNIKYNGWHEDYYISSNGSKPQHRIEDCGSFRFGFDNFHFWVTVDLTSKIETEVGKVYPQGLSYKIPKKSILYDNWKCVQKKIDQEMEKNIKGYDYKKMIEEKIKEILGT